MSEERVILSERSTKGVEWGREQQKKILNDKGERLTEALMEKMTPLILQRNTSK